MFLFVIITISQILEMCLCNVQNVVTMRTQQDGTFNVEGLRIEVIFSRKFEDSNYSRDRFGTNLLGIFLERSPKPNYSLLRRILLERNSIDLEEALNIHKKRRRVCQRHCTTYKDDFQVPKRFIKFKCSEYGKMTLTLYKTHLQCLFDGQIIDVLEEVDMDVVIYGRIVCPSCLEMCQVHECMHSRFFHFNYNENNKSDYQEGFNEDFSIADYPMKDQTLTSRNWRFTLDSNMATDSFQLTAALKGVVPSISGRLHCSHKPRRPLMTNIPKKGGINLKFQNEPDFLRIYTHYEDNFNKLPNRDFIKNKIIKPAVKFWEETVKVKYPTREPIILDRPCLNNDFDTRTYQDEEVKVCKKSCIYNADHVHLQKKCFTYGADKFIIETGEEGEGVDDTDLVILIDSGKDCTNTTLASALEDRIERQHNRPIIGSLVICPDTIDVTTNVEETIQTVKHEILHILGFSVSLFAYFRDEHGYPRTPLDEDGIPELGLIPERDAQAYKPSNNTMIFINQTEMTPIGERVRLKAMLVTPNIVREARAYYNCSTLRGVLLEDYGERGNAWSHFEMKTAYNELMSSASSEEVYLSRLSLALLEDSGWYLVDYSRAENFTFGKGLGCDFVNKNCFEYIHIQEGKNQSSSPWCANVDETICSKDRSMELSCAYQYGENAIQPEYRYYKDKKIYYVDPFIDYCPMYMTHYRESNLNFPCLDESSLELGVTPNSLIHSHGPSSKCFDAPFRSHINMNTCDSFNEYIVGGQCYKYRCSEKYGLLVKVRNEEYQCSFDGEIIFFSTIVKKNLLGGEIQCPKCSDICSKSLCAKKKIDLKQKNIRTREDNEQILKKLCSGASTTGSFVLVVFSVLTFILRQIQTIY